MIKLKKGTKVLRWTGVDDEELIIASIKKNLVELIIDIDSEVLISPSCIKIEKNKIKWQKKFNYNKEKWEYNWKAPSINIFEALKTTQTVGDWIETYDKNGKLLSMQLTDEARKETFWMLRNPYDLLQDNGYDVDEEKAGYLELFIEGDWINTYSWFIVAIVDKTHSDELVKWMIGPLKEFMTEYKIERLKKLPFNAFDFGLFVEKVVKKEITATMGKAVLLRMFNNEKLEKILEDDCFKITSSSEVEDIVDKVLQENPDQVAELKSGKDKLLGWLVGQVMKESRGKANAGDVNKMIKNKLGIV